MMPPRLRDWNTYFFILVFVIFVFLFTYMIGFDLIRYVTPYYDNQVDSLKDSSVMVVCFVIFFLVMMLTALNSERKNRKQFLSNLQFAYGEEGMHDFLRCFTYKGYHKVFSGNVYQSEHWILVISSFQYHAARIDEITVEYQFDDFYRKGGRYLFHIFKKNKVLAEKRIREDHVHAFSEKMKVEFHHRFIGMKDNRLPYIRPTYDYDEDGYYDR